MMERSNLGTGHNHAYPVPDEIRRRRVEDPDALLLSPLNITKLWDYVLLTLSASSSDAAVRSIISACKSELHVAGGSRDRARLLYV
jgi:hypothetical protein